tara:strand:- start:58 stop:330 length:273 start_codon:yes stop_codon:yes gene_type:complete
MTDLIDTNFKQSIELVKNYVNNINTTEKTFLYKYYKQATFGDVNISKPTGLFNITDKQKWEAWNSVKGTTKNDAKKIYSDFVNTLKTKYN